MNYAAARRSAFPRSLLPVLVLLGLSVFLNYVDRANLSVAAPQLRDELRLSASELGILLAAFFWTYAPSQLLSGWLVDRFDVKLVMAAGFFAWSAATGLTGLLNGFAALLVVRLLLGLCESVAYPSYSKIIARNFPEEHRGLANSVIAAGLACGPAFGMFAGGLLVVTVGWRVFFVGLGLVSMLWLVPWFQLMPREARTEQAAARNGVPSLGQFVRQRSAWGMCAGQFAGNYLSYSLITWLPFYLVRERHFSMSEAAVIAGSVYLSAAVSAATCGWASDRWIQAGGTPTRVRKTFLGVGCGLAGTSLFLSSLVASQALTVVLLMLAVVSFAMSASNLFAVSQTLAGAEAAGRWTGFQNFVGNLAGMVAPAVTGFILDRTGHFAWAFGVTAAIGVAGAFAFVFVVGEVEPVEWAATSPVLVKMRWPARRNVGTPIVRP